MEIITGVERRRRWRPEEKLRIIAESLQPGASVSAIARRHDMSRGLLWNWRRQARRGALATEQTPMFLPLKITDSPTPPPSRWLLRDPPAASDAGRIEIALPDGICIRLDHDFSLAALRRVITALRG